MEICEIVGFGDELFMKGCSALSANLKPQCRPMINKPPRLDKDYYKAPSIKALKRMGLIKRGRHHTVWRVLPGCRAKTVGIYFIPLLSGAVKEPVSHHQGPPPGFHTASG